MAWVDGLFYYPVKGCAGVELTDGVLELAGLRSDREFMIVDLDGMFVSQRREPRLAVVRPRLDDAGALLTLTAPGAAPLTFEVEPDGERRDVVMHGEPFRGADQGEQAAKWLSAVLERPCRLVRVSREHQRVSSGQTPGTALFADSSAVLVMTRRSVVELNERLAAKDAEPVAMARFRPNIVVDGFEEPHIEDGIRRMEVGQAELGFTKVATRCAVTTVDQRTGVRIGPEPLRTLADYRRMAGGVVLGTKFAVTKVGKVSLGDELRVTSWAE